MRFWWNERCPGDEAIAREYAADAQSFWTFGVSFMHGKAPLDDGGISCTRGNGGGPQLDVFLRHFHNPALQGTQPRPYDEQHQCQRAPTFINIDKMYGSWAVLHEFVHSIEYAYAWPDPGIAHCPDDPEKLRWWSEASASAADAAYRPGRNFRGEAIHSYLISTEKPLDAKRFNEGYSIYQFARYLDYVDHGSVGVTWEKLEHAGSVVEAIAVGTGTADRDGFLRHWADFTKHLINEPPWNLFQTLDNVDEGATFKEEKDLSLDTNEPDRTLVFDPKELLRLSVVFYRARVGGGVRSLTIVNPNAKDRDPNSRVRVKALVKIEGKNAAEDDWSDTESKFFCVDKRDERVKEIVLAVSNSTWEPNAPPQPFQPLKIIATNVGCHQFKGTTSDDSEGTARLVFKDVSFFMNIQESGHADVTFSPGPLPPEWQQVPVSLPRDAHVFASTEGSVTWSWTGTWTAPQGCGAASGSGTTAITPGQGVLIYFNGSRPDLPHYREYFGSGTVTGSVSGCGSSMDQRVSWVNIREGVIPANGELSGNVERDISVPTGTGHHKIRWSLQPVREPDGPAGPDPPIAIREGPP